MNSVLLSFLATEVSPRGDSDLGHHLLETCFQLADKEFPVVEGVWEEEEEEEEGSEAA
jgi:hypothetical protein